MHQSPSGLWRLPSKQDYRGSESRLVLHFYGTCSDLLNCEFRTSVSCQKEVQQMNIFQIVYHMLVLHIGFKFGCKMILYKLGLIPRDKV